MMKLRLATFLAVLSLALCVMICVLWIQSSRRALVVNFIRHEMRYELRIDGGRLIFDNSPEINFLIRKFAGQDKQWLALEKPVTLERDKTLNAIDDAARRGAEAELGLLFRRLDKATRAEEQLPPEPQLPMAPNTVNKSIAMWRLALATSLLPAISSGPIWYQRRNRKRRNHHMCVACGYDLRATPNRCPECGLTPT